jgi:hypothetical protein
MPVRLQRLTTGFPDARNVPVDWEGSWRVYTVLADGEPRGCTTRADIRGMDTSDKLSARSSLVSLSMKAQTGEPLNNLYDEKKCHEAHAFKVNPHDADVRQIWRVWGAGKIRMYFIYLPGKRIVLLKTAPKRTDRLSRGEQIELETLARNVLEASSEKDTEE